MMPVLLQASEKETACVQAGRRASGMAAAAHACGQSPLELGRHHDLLVLRCRMVPGQVLHHAALAQLREGLAVLPERDQAGTDGVTQAVGLRAVKGPARACTHTRAQSAGGGGEGCGGGNNVSTTMSE